VTKLNRTAVTALLTVTAVAGTVLATAGPASALSYKCNTSSKSIDDPAYDGPWADNWDFKVTVCAARSGSTVYSYSKVSWDGPLYGRVDDTSIFNAAYLRQQVKKSVSGTDPVLKKTDFYGIESKLENSDGNANYNGSYTTGTISYRVGSARGLGDAELKLEWANDGAGYKTYLFTASPTV
jgi:hypothetical protein